MIPARKCPKCHGFGHWASECTTETLIVFTPDGRVIEVEEENKPIWDEDPFEESEEPQLHADEERLFIVEHQHVQFDSPITELVGGPHFDLEYIDGLVPTEFEELQRQIDELFVDSSQPKQPAILDYTMNQLAAPWQDEKWTIELLQEEVAPSTHPKEKPIMTRATPLQTRDDETSWDLSKVEPCEMILPTEPQKTRLQILYSSNRPAQQEYKHLPVTDVPKLDLTWTKVKSKKILVGSIGKLRSSASILKPDTTPDPEMKAKPPEPRENDRDGLVTVAVATVTTVTVAVATVTTVTVANHYSNGRYYSGSLQ